MRHGVGQIQEERLFVVGLDKPNGLGGVVLREIFKNDRGLDGGILIEKLEAGPFDQWQHRHIVTVKHTEKSIEAVELWAKCLAAAEMPLADAGRRVTRRLEMLGKRDFRGWQAPLFLGNEYARDPCSQRVATS